VAFKQRSGCFESFYHFFGSQGTRQNYTSKLSPEFTGRGDYQHVESTEQVKEHAARVSGSNDLLGGVPTYL